MGEMNTLEELKRGLPEGTSKDDHRYVLENFVTSVFTNADKDERTCEIVGKKNAKDFNTSSHFIMLLSQFDGAYDEGNWEEKRKYCVFKAGSIMKALKAGQQPSRGNPNDPTNTGEREMPKPKAPVEEEKKESGGGGGPAIPDMDDLMADLAKLETGGGGTQPTANQDMPGVPTYQPQNNY